MGTKYEGFFVSKTRSDYELEEPISSDEATQFAEMQAAGVRGDNVLRGNSLRSTLKECFTLAAQYTDVSDSKFDVLRGHVVGDDVLPLKSDTLLHNSGSAALSRDPDTGALLYDLEAMRQQSAFADAMYGVTSRDVWEAEGPYDKDGNSIRQLKREAREREEKEARDREMKEAMAQRRCCETC